MNKFLNIVVIVVVILLTTIAAVQVAVSRTTPPPTFTYGTSSGWMIFGQTPSNEMSHIGNYTLPDVVLMTLVARFYGIPYLVTEPYSAYCRNVKSNCPYGLFDFALHIQHNETQKFWDHWDKHCHSFLNPPLCGL